MATRERLLCSILSFHTSLRLPNLITQEETPLPLVSYALFLGLIVFLSIYPWLKLEISIVILMSLRTSGRKLFRVTTLQYASSFRNLQIEDTRANVFPAGCPSIPFFVPYCSNIMTTTGSLLTHFVHLLNFKVLLHKAKKMTKRELSRQTPDCIGAKLLITSTALRAYQNRHLGTLMRCCEAWKPVEDCFDTLSFECIDFQRIIQIIAALLVKTLRHVKLRSQPSLGRKQKKTLLWLDAGVDNVPGATRNLCSLSVLSQMKRTTLRRMKMNQEEDFVSIGEPFSKHAKKARDITNMKIFCDMFNKLLMTSVGLLIRLSLTTSLLKKKRLGPWS